MTTIDYIDTFIGTVEVKGRKIPKTAKSQLARLAFGDNTNKKIKSKLLTKPDTESLWLAIYHKSQGDSQFLGCYKLEGLMCTLKHKPCGRECVSKEIDFIF